MMGLILGIHLIICLLLIGIILIQTGRGGGLVDAFSGVESIFGTKTNKFLTQTTTVLAILFFFTCIGLALLSAQKSKSLLRDIKIEEKTEETAPTETQEKVKQELPDKQPIQNQTQTSRGGSED